MHTHAVIRCGKFENLPHIWYIMLNLIAGERKNQYVFGIILNENWDITSV